MTTPNDPEFYAYLVDKAIAEYRIPAESRENRLAQFRRDPVGTRAVLATLTPCPEALVSADVPATVLAKADRWGQPPSDPDVVYSAVYPDCG